MTAGGKSLHEVKFQKEIFQWDTLSPLLLLIGMILINHLGRKSTGKYKFKNSLEKIHPRMYVYHIKLCAKIKKALETLIKAEKIYTHDIGTEVSIEK